MVHAGASHFKHLAGAPVRLTLQIPFKYPVRFPQGTQFHLTTRRAIFTRIASMNANQIRRGNIIIYNGEPCRVLEFQHRTPGNLRAFVQVKLRNIKNGSSTETRFSATESVERATLEQHDMEYLYSDGDLYHFMNTETYEQIGLNDEQLGDATGFLIEGLKIQVEFYDGTPIGIELPPVVELSVVETEPELKGATASNSNKPAKLSTGVTIMVPPFVKEGDVVRVDPNDGRYIERAK